MQNNALRSVGVGSRPVLRGARGDLPADAAGRTLPSQNEVNARPTVGRFAITVALNEWQLDRNCRPLPASPQAALSV